MEKNNEKVFDLTRFIGQIGKVLKEDKAMAFSMTEMFFNTPELLLSLHGTDVNYSFREIMDSVTSQSKGKEVLLPILESSIVNPNDCVSKKLSEIIQDLLPMFAEVIKERSKEVEYIELVYEGNKRYVLPFTHVLFYTDANFKTRATFEVDVMSSAIGVVQYARDLDVEIEYIIENIDDDAFDNMVRRIQLLKRIQVIKELAGLSSDEVIEMLQRGQLVVEEMFEESEEEKLLS